MNSSTPSTTTFVSRGRLSGVICERLPRRHSTGAAPTVKTSNAGGQLDRQARDEAIYYRARLILGDSLPRPLP